MTRAYDQYGKLAESEHPPLVQAARYATQEEAERLIVADLERKLELAPSHALLEIGCGPGNLLIPLSFRVKRAVGIDHPNVIARAMKRYSAGNLEWIGGEFPAVDPKGPFDRILTYAVLHYLEDFAAVTSFVDAASQLLAPGGRLILGDLPNADRKARFLATEEGRAFEAEWREKMKAAAASAGWQRDAFEIVAESRLIGTFSDAQILELLRRARTNGFHAYVMRQPPDLPFGHTREDVVIERP
jgi:trans-aconitate methyltransferase